MSKNKEWLWPGRDLLTVNSEEKAKILHDKEPRFLEDEGFYVGTRPKISGWNVNKMENRLIKELHVISHIKFNFKSDALNFKC